MKGTKPQDYALMGRMLKTKGWHSDRKGVLQEVVRSEKMVGKLLPHLLDLLPPEGSEHSSAPHGGSALSL